MVDQIEILKFGILNSILIFFVLTKLNLIRKKFSLILRLISNIFLIQESFQSIIQKIMINEQNKNNFNIFLQKQKSFEFISKLNENDENESKYIDLSK